MTTNYNEEIAYYGEESNVMNDAIYIVKNLSQACGKNQLKNGCFSHKMKKMRGQLSIQVNTGPK